MSPLLLALLAAAMLTARMNARVGPKPQELTAHGLGQSGRRRKRERVQNETTFAVRFGFSVWLLPAYRRQARQF
jgi:hypothetical protein